MPVQLRAVAFATAEALQVAAGSWAGLLDRRVGEDGYGVLVPGDEMQLGLRFVASLGQRSGLNRMHLHLTSTSPRTSGLGCGPR